MTLAPWRTSQWCETKYSDWTDKISFMGLKIKNEELESDPIKGICSVPIILVHIGTQALVWLRKAVSQIYFRFVIRALSGQIDTENIKPRINMCGKKALGFHLYIWVQKLVQKAKDKEIVFHSQTGYVKIWIVKVTNIFLRLSTRLKGALN